MKRLTWKIGGEAGFGIMVAGLTFSKALSRAGYHTVEINEYPSLIRGGHNTIAVTFSDEPVEAPYRPVHVLIALNKQTVDYHVSELADGASIVIDAKDYSLASSLTDRGIHVCHVPLLELSQKVGGNMLIRNTVALGASMALLDIPLEQLTSVITGQFIKKGDKVVALNVGAAKEGYDYVKSQYPGVHTEGFSPKPEKKQMVVTGAEAAGLGALAGGMKFFAAYPMTPINALLAYMAGVQKKAGVVYKQPEDEIAAINMAIGASFAGVRSMVATSGGGFCLMVEGVSFAGMIERPVVIIMGMRPGPSTGLPTWTGQGDLHFILHAGHGEFPRIVLAPGDAQETFELTAQAFNLADICQTPVILLVDKYLFETRWTTALFDPGSVRINRGKLLTEEEQNAIVDLPRYQHTDDGISARGIPGRPGGIFRENSDEHNEHGYSDEEADNTRYMIEKRLRKLQEAQKLVPDPVVYGDPDADVTFVGWGSTKGAVLEAMKELRSQSVTSNYLHITHINPFPSDAVKNILSKAKHIVDVEGNHDAQMAEYICMRTGITIKDKILKYDGRPFYPEDIIEGLKKLT